MIDGNGRAIEYLRISITDRCNLRCVYCMPEGGMPAAPHDAILSYEEIVRVVRIMSGLGIRHLRVTGGEPMVRLGCLELIRALSGIPGIEDVGMTSNGTLLSNKVGHLRAAGVSSLNLSIDTLEPETYARLTRGGDIKSVLDTLAQAVEAGIQVKVNAVPVRGFNDGELAGLARLAENQPICVRFIELMPIGCAAGLRAIPQNEIVARLEAEFGPLAKDPVPHGHGPAQYMTPNGFLGAVGFISPLSHTFCESCNRVRLTADGQLKLCLNHAQGLDLRELLRSGADDLELEGEIRNAILKKPKCHEFNQDIGDREVRRMNQIGG